MLPRSMQQLAGKSAGYLNSAMLADEDAARAAVLPPRCDAAHSGQAPLAASRRCEASRLLHCRGGGRTRERGRLLLGQGALAQLLRRHALLGAVTMGWHLVGGHEKRRVEE